MVAPIAEGFSLTHAQILDGSETFQNATSNQDKDVYGVDQASLDPDQGDYDNEGDDVVLSTWHWLNYATVEVRGGYVTFPLIASLTGRTLESSGTGDDVRYSIDLWHEDSFNVPTKPMLIRMPSKDSEGNVRTMEIGLYRVQFMPITFDGPAYKDGLKINYSGRALLSPLDEVGTEFADGKKRIGKLISKA